MRKAEIIRKTAETDIKLSLNLDGKGESSIDTSCPFLDHMLTLFARHGRFDLNIKCVGDIEVDYHHTTEDIGIALGQAFKEALGDKKGITRYGDTTLPMDESLILTAVDISGRGGCYYEVEMPTEKVGDFDTELNKEFWDAFAYNSGITTHMVKFAGLNSHHIIEGCFKSIARTLRTAVAIDKAFADDIPSTKGVIA
ncbi:MAG: imidazoleglycerol-phosphate dehydratase HisB [Clostridia bacterium]|nr:imidazoleglycerol-phosphate dehydratase HisB [Clostridia bacterium]